MFIEIHPIQSQSFAIIDQEIGEHSFNSAEYAIVRRVIHSTADFEFSQLIRFSPNAIEQGILALKQQVPIIVDVGMVKQGVANLVAKTFNNPLICAVEMASTPLAGKTLTETGLIHVVQEFPQSIIVIGNAPTALISLCSLIEQKLVSPSLVIGVPVGFVSVVESKMMLAQMSVPQIRVEGRKGGSPVAAAILNALIVLATSEK
ncbi:Cobalt-precorrin-8 methylmutase [Planktothrix tepida]|uniref:Cobalt-precorrin-8X methylmutase n=1 Tax=Planktothrix tepida PCC 9214 TaxID=671072 RepID=A0A1J1LR27_9CYAN|nr:cobalt-precorrin-8X methylmutase [Planktothrix tepida]CAD5960024.1 Cobalt-precorrin-8 methylmutase [Planktothrix tepida]CUR34678.1 Cobalt-precorrin-8X methylmutase [Planktothrix tepida PCC 9214]